MLQTVRQRTQAWQNLGIVQPLHNSFGRGPCLCNFSLVDNRAHDQPILLSVDSIVTRASRLLNIIFADLFRLPVSFSFDAILCDNASDKSHDPLVWHETIRRNLAQYKGATWRHKMHSDRSA